MSRTATHILSWREGIIDTNITILNVNFQKKMMSSQRARIGLHPPSLLRTRKYREQNPLPCYSCETQCRTESATWLKYPRKVVPDEGPRRGFLGAEREELNRVTLMDNFKDSTLYHDQTQIVDEDAGHPPKIIGEEVCGISSQSRCQK